MQQKKSLSRRNIPQAVFQKKPATNAEWCEFQPGIVLQSAESAVAATNSERD